MVLSCPFSKPEKFILNVSGNSSPIDFSFEPVIDELLMLTALILNGINNVITRVVNNNIFFICTPSTINSITYIFDICTINVYKNCNLYIFVIVLYIEIYKVKNSYLFGGCNMKKFFKSNMFSKVILIISIIFSLFFICGYAIFKTSTIDVLFYDPINILVTIFIFCLFVPSFYIFIYLLYSLFDNLRYKENSSKLYNFIFEKHPFLIPFLIFIIVGIPFIIYFYPGTVQWDGMKQIDYFYGIKNWSNHHPAFSTLVMGTCVKIGRALIDDNFGIFLYTFPQFILSCATFSYILVFLRKIKTPKCIIVFTFLFFLLNPVWYINSYTLVKDTMFYLFFIIFFIEFINYFYGENNKYKLLLISLLIILFRNNGIYVVLGSFILLWIFKKGSKKINTSFIVFMVLFQIAYNIVISSCGIVQGNVREMLSNKLL